MLYDKDIREPLAFYLEEIYGKNRILEEQVMGQSRADMVMVVHDALYGIEIKSDADSYARLDRQVKDYNLYYDYDLVVVGTRHAAHIKEHVPEWWGIITVEQVGDQVDFYMLREPQSNPQIKLSRQFRKKRWQSSSRKNCSSGIIQKSGRRSRTFERKTDKNCVGDEEDGKQKNRRKAGRNRKRICRQMSKNG